MSHATKYTLDERKIARKIHEFQKYRSKAYDRWQFYDMKINIFIKKLKGKYKTRSWHISSTRTKLRKKESRNTRS